MNYEEIKERYKNSNLSISLIDAYNEVNKYDNKIHNDFMNFINKCKEFEMLHNANYEIQKTLKMNKIFFQCYISELDVCGYLRENKYTECTLEQLKNFLKDYENNSNDDLSSYYEAIDLCKMVDDLEELVDTKIEFEMNTIYDMTTLIGQIENIEENKYQELYINIKNEITNNYLNKNLIDNTIMQLILHMLNDIFNYFISGYPVIPDEYLNNNIN